MAWFWDSLFFIYLLRHEHAQHNWITPAAPALYRSVWNSTTLSSPREHCTQGCTLRYSTLRKGGVKRAFSHRRWFGTVIIPWQETAVYRPTTAYLPGEKELIWYTISTIWVNLIVWQQQKRAVLFTELFTCGKMERINSSAIFSLRKSPRNLYPKIRQLCIFAHSKSRGRVVPTSEAVRYPVLKMHAACSPQLRQTEFTHKRKEKKILAMGLVLLRAIHVLASPDFSLKRRSVT